MVRNKTSVKAGTSVLLVVTAAGATAAAELESVQGRFLYESGDGENPSYSMGLDVVDGIAVLDELQGGERVKVVLVGEPRTASFGSEPSPW